MAKSTQLAGLIGPAMIAVAATEALNLDMFAGQIAPVVYLDGAILFVAGLALVRAHNVWAWRWPILITFTAWILLLGGLYRMIAPTAPQAPQSAASYAMFAVMIAIGVFLSYQGYRRERAGR